MKFLIDIGLSPKTVSFLQNIGYGATRINELGMARAKDKEILEYAAENDMVVITADLDFGDILAHLKYKKPSVIIFRLVNPSPEYINSKLLSSLPSINHLLEKGAIVIIEDYRVRVRELPIR